MRNTNPNKRAIVISLFVIALTFWNFSRQTGTESIRAIHVVTLLTCGAAIGVLLTNLFFLLRKK